MGLKISHRVRGEVKWRYFSPHNTDPLNPFRNLDQPTRNQFREALFRAVTSESSITTLGCVCSAVAAYEIPSLETQEDLYHSTYKPVTERFQYYLQDISRTVGSKQHGIIVADHRGSQDDKRLRGHHQKLLHSSGEFTTRYDNLIEGLFLEPSNLSIGIQLADLVAGAIWRKFERGDDTWFNLLEPSLRRNASGSVYGHGIVLFPKKGWR